MLNTTYSRRLFFYLSLILILSIFLSGCEKEVIVSEEEKQVTISQESYIYEECSIKIKEPQSINNLSQSMKHFYSESSITYYFAETIEPKNRDEFINAQKYLIQYLQTSKLIDDFSSSKYYILGEYPSRSNSANKEAYFDITDRLTYKQILTTLQSFFGDEVNYGLLFGISNRIAFELGWETDIPNISQQEILTFTNSLSNDKYLFLDYPCFLEEYNSNNQEEIHVISFEVANYIFQNKATSSIIELLSLQQTSLSLFEYQWTEIINQWLLSIGSQTQILEKENPVAFSYGGTVSPLIIHTKHAHYYLLNDYEESQIREAEIDYFKTDYETLLFTIDTLENDMNDADLLFRDPEKSYSPYSIVLCSYEQTFSSSGAFAYYSSYNHTSYNSSVMAITHEYIHYLTTPSRNYNWQYESIAIYYNLPSYFQTISSNLHLDVIRSYQTPEAISLYNYLGKDFQAEDFPTYCDIHIVLYNYNQVNERNPYAMISVLNYVKNIYGDDIAKEIFLNQNRIEQEISLTWSELIDEWDQWLLDTYGYLIVND